MLAADGVVDFRNEHFVLLHGLQDLQKALLPGVVGFLPGQRTGGALDAGPLDQVVDILKMVVERHAVDAAVLGQVGDGDLVQRLLGQQVFQRRNERTFGHLGHGSLLLYNAVRRTRGVGDAAPYGSCFTLYRKIMNF